MRPKITEAAFECQRCGTMTYIPQTDSGFQEPHECQGCERQGPFRLNTDQSQFIDAQKLRVQESPEGLRGGETPQSIDINIEDDITGHVTAGDHVTVTGVLHIEQQTSGQEKTPIFDLYMDGVSIEIEDEEFEDMDISEEDVAEIVELSNDPDIYQKMIGSVAPSIYGYEQEKLAMILQLFSGVTKHLPDGSRIRGDLHMLLIGDPGTGKCVARGYPGNSSRGPRGRSEGGQSTRGDTTRHFRQRTLLRFDVNYAIRWNSSHANRDQGLVAQGTGPIYLDRARSGGTGRPSTVRRIASRTPAYCTSPGPPDCDRCRNRRCCRSTVPQTCNPVVGVPQSQAHNRIDLDLPPQWTPELARLIGYIVAEGYVEQRPDNTGYVSITNDDREVLDDAKLFWTALILNVTERSSHEGKTARELLCSAGEFGLRPSRSKVAPVLARQSARRY